MNIFCINLQRATERKQFITEKWIHNLGFDINFWTAYDKNLIDNNQYYYQYDNKLAQKIFNRSLNNGEIACATSFYQLFEHILQNDIDECIIMEDDIIPLIESKNTLFIRLEQAKEEFSQASLILMHSISPKQQNNYKPTYGATINEIYYLKGTYASMCKRAPWGNQCFYITKQAVKTIYDNLCIDTNSPVIWHPADYCSSLYLCETMSVYILNHPVCDHDWSGLNVISYIGH